MGGGLSVVDEGKGSDAADEKDTASCHGPSPSSRHPGNVRHGPDTAALAAVTRDPQLPND